MSSPTGQKWLVWRLFKTVDFNLPACLYLTVSKPIARRQANVLASVKKLFRATFRFCRVMVLCTRATIDFIFGIWLAGKSANLQVRAQWLQRWCKVYLHILNARVIWKGEPPTRGILVSNHLSYLDILVYGSICPMVFISKSEVRSWPVIGAFTRCAGTLYIRRQSKADVARLGADMVPVVNAGVVVTMFPEGTSTGGDKILPFHSSLLAPAEAHDWSVTGAWLNYSVEDGSVREEICYWRDMTFLPHILNVFSKRGFEAFIQFDTPLPGKLDRKEMAQQLQARISRIRAVHLGEAIMEK
jgi:1-acyl-sn-glycerol-3-phosphate acyltransferase